MIKSRKNVADQAGSNPQPPDHQSDVPPSLYLNVPVDKWQIHVVKILIRRKRETANDKRLRKTERLHFITEENFNAILCWYSYYMLVCISYNDLKYWEGQA